MRRPELLALVLAAAGCGGTEGACGDLRGARAVGSGRYAMCPATQHPGDAAVPDAAAPVPPGAVQVDRATGVVTFTRDVDGGRVVARYRIVQP